MEQASKRAFRPWDWLWQGRRMKGHRASLASTRPERKELIERARIAHEQAKRLANEPPHNAAPHLPALSVQLFAEVIYWSLAAEAERRAGELDAGAAMPTYEALMERSQLELAGLLTRPEREGSVRELLARFDAEPHALLPSRDPVTESQLEVLAERLLESADSDARAVRRIWFQRLLRVGVPLAILVVLSLGAKVASDRARLAEETMIPWRASSTHPEPGCQSPRQGCEQDHFFFHTRGDREPWIEFDLSERPSVSKVTVVNRTDCHGCSARAVPLVLEVSDDRENWQVLAQRDTDFVTWTATFPRTNARWLRLRVARPSYLHLRQVRIER